MRGTQVQDQSEGATVACCSAKAGDGIYTMGLRGDAQVTLQIKREG
jgi:hypothetical protein